MTDDIVTRLRDVVCWCNEFDGVCDACQAAAEIERLREQVKAAHNILGSETMVWVFHGSENWLESNLQHLRDPIHAYWEKYGNAFKEARRG